MMSKNASSYQVVAKSQIKNTRRGDSKEGRMAATKKSIVLLLSIVFAPSVAAQPSDWEKTWDGTLAAARREGKVVIAGSPDPVMRNVIVPKFTARYGIPVDFLAGRSGEIAGRVRIERSAGVYTVDAYLAGADTSYNVLYPEKMIDPLKPLMILPEVTDNTKWKRGALSFVDPEERYVLRLFSKVASTFFINTDYVKPEEMRSANDLLNPKWTGKIATEDPTDESGSGGNTATDFYNQFGPEFVRKLYVDQKPAISRDRRQFTDWLARGIYPICLTCRGDDVRLLQKEGFKISGVYEITGLKGRVTSSPFLVSVANKAPHPNAARVFVNWMATKEPLEIYSRNNDTATLRNDVDESFLDPHSIPREGVSYLDDNDPQWRSVDKVEIGNKLRLLLKKP
jgi:iron(III) transport system substrate-binding protein